MINWIIGGLIIAAALFVMVKSASRVSSGKGCSNCGGCAKSDENSCERKDDS